MILRKPYAFLIKYFKLIHILMFILFGYLVFALRKIYIFFADYIKTSNFTYVENMTSRFVPWIMYLAVIVLLSAAIGILLLMRKKEKPVLFYKVMIGYMLYLLAILIYFTVFFKSLDDTVYEPLKIVVNRDIILFTYVFNFFFVLVSFIRGFGFDIKKFSFEKDKKELKLEESDSEEYELSVDIEKDDIKTFINRHLREFKYYIKANKTFLVIVASVIIVALLVYGYSYFFVTNRVYHENDNISHGQITYRVNRSIISNTDKYGRDISKNNTYLIIDLNIINNQANGYLDEQALRLHTNDKYYYPTSSSCDLFNDFGTCYKNQELKVNTDNNFIVVYKIDKDYSSIYLEILKNKADEYKYSKVKLSYIEMNQTKSDYKLNQEFKINDNPVTINGYVFVDKTSYTYMECSDNGCVDYEKIVSPNIGETVLILHVSGLSSLSDEFINSAIGIKSGDKLYTGKEIQLITRYSDFIYFSVPNHLKYAKNTSLIITTRDYIYNISLAGDNNE